LAIQKKQYRCTGFYGRYQRIISYKLRGDNTP